MRSGLESVTRHCEERKRRSNLDNEYEIIFLMSGDYYIYILTNKSNVVLYTGVTNNLGRRTFEHKSGLVKGFTKKYKANKSRFKSR